MNLQDITPARAEGITAIHFGRAEPGELARLVSDPRAVLKEAGLNISEDIQIDLLLDTHFPGEGVRTRPELKGVDYIVVVNSKVYLVGITPR
jgi:hypothetical protein